VTDDGPAYQYAFTVTDAYRRTLTRALIGAGYRSLGLWMLVVVVLVAGVGSALLLAGAGPMVVALVVDAALLAAVPLAARHRVNQAAALGSVARSGFGPTSFRLGQELPGMLVEYGRIEEVSPRGDLVWLRIRMTTSTARAAWPRELFPDAEIARLRAGAGRDAASR
jgi:hypothetical protein